MKRAETNNKKRKWPWVLLGVVGGLILLVIITILVISSLLFDKAPEFPVDSLRQEDYTLATKLVGRLIGEIRSGRTAESELVLTPAEVASLVRCFDNGMSLQSMLKGESAPQGRTKPVSIRFEDGQFDVIAPCNTQIPILGSKTIVLDLSFRVEKDGSELTLEIPRLQAGAFSATSSIREKVRQEAITEFKKQREYREFDAIIKSIRVDENNALRIIYHPAEIDRLLPNDVRKMLFLPARRK